MGKLTVIAALTLIVSANSLAADPAVAPDFTLSTPNGDEITLSDAVDHRTTVLFFWATWCPYCKALMPHLQSIRIEHGTTVEIMAINIKEDGDPVSFVEDAGYDFTLLLHGDLVAEDYGVTGTPGVFIVDGERNIRFNLRDLPRLEPPNAGERPSHSRRSAYLAPYWAAEIRKSIAALKAEQAP